MKMLRDGDTLVTTPIYVGGAGEVVKAARCTHDYAPVAKPEIKLRVVMQAEKCSKCVAFRTRITPIQGATIEEAMESL